MNITSLEELQDWLENNLVDKDEASQITKQSKEGFSQSVKLGYIKPFIQTKSNERFTNRLYLKSDLEEYAKNKRS